MNSPSILAPIKQALRRARDMEVWRPGRARLLWSQVANRDRNPDMGFTDQAYLLAAARWLARAQDAMTDGGVAGRYRLSGGWTSSYPETTGYIIPTFLALAAEVPEQRFVERAGRCVEFLLRLQLDDGAFPGGEVDENRSEPSVFNTAQILGGLAAWHAVSNDRRVLDSCRRAADWLVGVQGPDGAWRTHIYKVASTYSAHASCWLAEFGQATGATSYLDAASRHLDWVLEHQDPSTGWFDLAGFTDADHEARRAVTHTISYTLWGVLRSSEVLQRGDGISAVEVAARQIARRLELGGWLPGVLDHRWRGRATYACLTGNVQMGLVWMRLFEGGGDPIFLNAALKAIDLVTRAQPMFFTEPGVKGAVAGSDPVWGDYVANAYPNWPAKFLIDALLEKRRILSNLPRRSDRHWQPPPDVPQGLPNVQVTRAPGLRVVMYTHAGSPKVPDMLTSWAAIDFKPCAVLVETPPAVGVTRRIVMRIRTTGVRGLASGVLTRTRTKSHDAPGPREKRVDVRAYCRENGVPCFDLATVNSPEGLSLLRGLEPDLAIHAGAGILRNEVLGVPRLGTLNAHMGVLPFYRGINVAEWASFSGGPVGCTVHLIDPGIDTGPILCVDVVDAAGTRSVQELRHVVDEAQVNLLGQVLQFILSTGLLPPPRAQRPDEGRQHFRMHPELLRILEADLAGRTAKLGAVAHSSAKQ